MGLDGVELILATEERFGVHIFDEEAEHIRTPRMLYELVARKLVTPQPESCLTQRAFYRLRRAVQSTFAIPRNRISLDLRFEQIIPFSKRREQWNELGAQVGTVTWPDLKTLPAIPLTFELIALASSAWVAMSVASSVSDRIIVFLGSIIITTYLGQWLIFSLPQIRLAFPSYGRTLRDLSKHLVEREPALFAPPEALSRDTIRLEVRKIVREQLGLEDIFSDDADFVDDLGLN